MLYHKHYQVRDTIIPLVRSKGSLPHTNDLTRPPAVTDRQKEKEKKRYPGCLAQVVNGMFYSVAVNRRQPNIDSGGGGTRRFNKCQY